MAENRIMHAVHYNSYGGGPAALKHLKIPNQAYLQQVHVSVPTPNKDEVLMKLEAISLNPVDWKTQKGTFRPLLPYKFPFIPATDVAGEVLGVGSDVKNFKAGDKVVAMISQTTLTEAAGIKLDGSGEQTNIRITAASGGVGDHYAVQLAKLGNTHVTATCGARNIELVKSLGAVEVVDYTTPVGATIKSPCGRKYDAVIHCATGIPWSTFEPNLSEYGKVIDIAPPLTAMFSYYLNKVAFPKKQLVPIQLKAKGENLDYLVKLMKQGKLKTVIDSKHFLSKVEDTWAKSIDGHATGKIIVEPYASETYKFLSVAEI
ncbi:hypothetical protein LWI28_000851 [Acer negundo]|uniref:Enoyl reductase (ER) domain-containing protein n=1 Tax=Acer negundo TaxID=4023 RepID=A0AAD5NR77_ACENE|nr:hypothetical protein LWI28_000851 [Acer negundo]